MRRKTMTAVSLALCTIIGASACGNKEENVFTGETGETLAWQGNLDAVSPSVYADIDDLDLEPGTYISVIGKTSGTSYWDQVQAGVEQAADDINEKLGYTGDDKVKVLFNAPSGGEDIDEQVNILDEELARYPDVIAIASIDENASAVQFDLAIENGIPIVAFDSGNSYQDIQCTCMTDNEEAARTGAQKLCSAIADSGEVVLIVQDSVSANARERAEAFQKAVAEDHPGVTVAETVYMDRLDDLKRQAAAKRLGVTPEDLATWTEAAAGADSGSDSTESSAQGEDMSETAKTKLEDIDSIAEGMSDEEAVQYCLEKYPDLAGCFGTNADAVMLGAEVLADMEKTEEITLMGFDAGAEQIAALENGAVDGLVVQNPFGMGYAAVVAAARTVLEIGNEAVVDTGYVWVDRDNMENESIQSMLYE